MARTYMNRVVCTLALLLASGTSTAQTPLDSVFTYQGNLQEGGVPVDDMCAFEFSLWDDDNDPDPGVQIGPTLIFDGGAGNELSGLRPPFHRPPKAADSAVPKTATGLVITRERLSIPPAASGRARSSPASVGGAHSFPRRG